MSYNVAITRRGDHGAAPISPDELPRIVAHDRRWKLLPPSDDYGLWRLIRNDDGEDWRVDLDDGELVATSPENDQLLDLQKMATLLGARVIGEDGADLTNARIGESWTKKALFGAGGIAGAALLVWLQRKLTGRW